MIRDWAMRPSARGGLAAVGAALIIGSTLLMPSAGALAQETSLSPVAQVMAVRAKKACFSSMIRVTGFLVAREEAMVTLDVPGFRVAEVMASVEDRVTAGQGLVRLTREGGEGPDNAAGGDITLRAPAAGTIIRSTAVLGMTSPAPTEPLFRIAIDNDVELEVDVPSTRVPELSPGQSAYVTVEGGRKLTGRVRLVPAQIDRRTQLGQARISLERDSSLRIGVFARATIDASRSCGVSVPRSAVLYRTEGTSVQVANNGVIATRLVQVGLHSDTETEIRDGIRENDVVVASAGTSLRDGDKVTPIFAEDTQ